MKSNDVRDLRFATLAWGRNTSCSGRLVDLRSSCLSCLASANLSPGCPVVLTVQLDDFKHELIGRVTVCKPAGDGEYLVRVGMEYADIETQHLLNGMG